MSSVTMYLIFKLIVTFCYNLALELHMYIRSISVMESLDCTELYNRILKLLDNNDKLIIVIKSLL